MPADIAIFATLFSYSDWSSRVLCTRAAALSDQQLDQPLDIGRGKLRVNLMHTLVGETVWLARWKETPSVPWPSEDQPLSPQQILARFEDLWKDRDGFLATLAPYRLAREQTYRDSKGSLFIATLEDMIIQGFMHTKHHQAQSVNMIRRVGGEPPELDYMYRVRKPVV
jgi:uncharacterized damage-inducible protein DinB